MKAPIGRLSLWQEVVVIGMSNKLPSNSSLDQLRQETQIGYWSA